MNLFVSVLGRCALRFGCRSDVLYTLTHCGDATGSNIPYTLGDTAESDVPYTLTHCGDRTGSDVPHTHTHCGV